MTDAGEAVVFRQRKRRGNLRTPGSALVQERAGQCQAPGDVAAAGTAGSNESADVQAAADATQSGELVRNNDTSTGSRGIDGDCGGGGDDDDQSLAAAEARLLQQQRRRKRGLDASKLVQAAAATKASGFAAESAAITAVERSISSGGGIVSQHSSDDQLKDKLNEAFKSEQDHEDVQMDAHMRQYIAERLAAEESSKGEDAPIKASSVLKDRDQERELGQAAWQKTQQQLYEVPEHLNVATRQPALPDESVLQGIPEVDIPSSVHLERYHDTLIAVNSSSGSRQDGRGVGTKRQATDVLAISSFVKRMRASQRNMPHK